MMKKLFMMLVCCTVVATANAQLGGLVKKAKQATEKVKNNANVGVSSSSNSVIPGAAVPTNREEAEIAKAGGLQKYLRLDDEAGQTVWRYYQMFQEFTSGKSNKEYMGAVAELGDITGTLISDYKILKSGNKEDIAGNKMRGNYPGRFNTWVKKAKDVTTWDFHPVPEKDSKHFIEVIERMRTLFKQREKEYDL